MRCQACGAENRSGKKFCAQCGTRLTSACPSCGSAVEPGSKFCGDCGAPLGGAVGSEAVETSPVSTTAPTDATAERRQLTVMFVDLVGSTELSTRLDPEDLREVLATYHAFIAEVVNEHGGYVAQFLGDGALVYFGYPTSHEDDAERSVRTALALLARTSGLMIRGNDIRIRIGIATGLVVVGDKALGSDAAHEPRIMGETPNLAARLQGMANPNAIVIAESTRQLVGNLFDLEDLGPKDIKGISGVRAWAVLRGASAFESRFEALHATGLTALVGRDEECELLLRRWSKAKTGEGQVALLSGEAGIGKSRLTAALMERVAAEPHTRLRYFCSPQHDRISTESRVRFRIGVHLGEVMVRDTDIYGDGVNVAARLQALAEPGGICVSDRIQRRRASSTVFLKT